MESEFKMKALADIGALSSTYIQDYENRLALGQTTKEAEIELLKEMIHMGVETARMQEQTIVPAGYKYKIQQLALCATLNHLQSEEFQLPETF
jgi:hypothetical protein